MLLKPTPSNSRPITLRHRCCAHCLGIILLLIIGSSCGRSRTSHSPPSASLEPLQDALDAVAAEAIGDAVTLSALVIDAGSGETLWKRHARRLLHPASTQKLLTSLSIFHSPVISELLPMATRLSASSKSGGRMVLRGACDPLLTENELAALVSQLKQRGVKDLVGPLLVVDPLFGERRFGKGWMWDDEPGAFMPHLSGISVNRGCIRISVNAEEVEIEPKGHGVPVHIHQGAKSKATISRDWISGGNAITITRAAGSDTARASRTLSVAKPAEMTGRVLSQLVHDNGLSATPLPITIVPLTHPDLPDDSELTISSQLRRPLIDVIKRSHLPSDNLAAELLLRWLPALRGLRAHKQPATEKEALEALATCLRQCHQDPTQYRLADGSGVSHYNLISAALLVNLMQGLRETHPKQWERFKASLPVSGSSGTISKRMSGTAAEGRVYAKTGTIGGVSNLAGIIETRGGRTLHFAFLIQNFVGSARPWRALQDRLCARLVEEL